MDKRPGEIDLNIGELVVRDLGALDAAGIRAVLEKELAGLVAEQGLPPAQTETVGGAGLEGGASEGEAGRASAAVGIQVARAVFRKLRRCR